MSRDAGGLAQMTYPEMNSGLGAPTAGFASRGKGSQLKRLNLASPPKVAPISENSETVSTPRTSRSHLLAGLRTAPKTPSANPPASAPYHQTQHRFGLDSSRAAADNTKSNNNNNYTQGPQTAIGTSFTTSTYNQQGNLNANQQMYPHPEQVLAPPQMQFDGPDDEQMDPNVLAQLVATELFLEQRRKQLQQQLLQLTAQGMNVNAIPMGLQFQNPSTPMTPNLGFYNQQLMNGMPIPQELPGHPGIYLVYNPHTGQYQYAVDQSAQLQQQGNGSPPNYSATPARSDNSGFRSDGTPTPDKNNTPFFSRSNSPPKKTSSPAQEVVPLPPPSANAFRRGHNKKSSLALGSVDAANEEGQKPRGGAYPQTPMTSGFGPGQGRAGEHPTRQPRGPPPIEELKAAPTSKHEGSKNFAARQRRRAVHSLVRAGIERRGVRSGSGGTTSPVSETELTFSLSSDNDAESVQSGNGSLSSKPSIGSLRAAASGAIGSERKQKEQRTGSPARGWSVNSISSDEGRRL